jgi:hypothetical protein
LYYILNEPLDINTNPLQLSAATAKAHVQGKVTEPSISNKPLFHERMEIKAPPLTPKARNALPPYTKTLIPKEKT